MASGKMPPHPHKDPKLPPPGQHPSVPSSKISSLFAEARIYPYMDSTVASSRTPTTVDNAIRDIAWNPLGTLCATADPRVLRVWNPERVAQSTRYSIELKPQVSGSRYGQQHLTGTARVQFCPARDAELASLGIEGTLRLWDVRNRAQCVGTLDAGGEGTSLLWSDEDRIVIGRRDNTAVHIDKRTMDVLKEVKAPCRMNSLSFTNTGRQMILCGEDGGVRLVKTESMEVLYTMKAHTSPATVAIQSPRGQYIATGGNDALVTLWDVDGFHQTKSFTEMSGNIRSLSFSHDGAYLTAGGTRPSENAEGKRGIQIWHVERGEVVHTIQTGLPTPCVRFHPGHYLIAFADTVGLKILFAPMARD